MKKAVVIGAGLGGLATAIRLAGDSWKVSVYDRQSFTGGKAGSKQIGSYRFDTGPSLLTMPEVFYDLFESVGRRLEDYLQLIPLGEVCKYFYHDGIRLSSFTDKKRFALEVEQKTMASAEELENYLNYSRNIYEVSSGPFLKNSLHELSILRSKNFWRSLARIFSIDPLRSMNRANESKFSDEKMVQFFNRYATYNGSNPYSAPATLNIIPHVEYSLGAAAVRGGIYAVPQALTRLAREMGVDFHLDEEVQGIFTTLPGPGKRNTGIKGVQTNHGSSEADVVVSNADVFQTYQYLLKDNHAPLLKRYKELEPSSSALVFYFGMKDSFPELGLHNIFFSNDYRKEFNEIFRERKLPENPTIYINITSKIDPQDARTGGENWFVLVNAPYHDGRLWQEEQTRIREHIIKTVERHLKRSIRNSIEVEEVMNPQDIEEQTGSSYGSLYGISSNSRMAAFRRHPNRSRRYKGLYFVGGSVHPGGGMPLVLLSGKITADLIRKHHGSGKE